MKTVVRLKRGNAWHLYQEYVSEGGEVHRLETFCGHRQHWLLDHRAIWTGAGRMRQPEELPNYLLDCICEIRYDESGQAVRYKLRSTLDVTVIDGPATCKLCIREQDRRAREERAEEVRLRDLERVEGLQPYGSILGVQQVRADA